MKPTQSEFYEHCKMFFCMGCTDKGESEEGCETCPVGDVPLDPPDRDVPLDPPDREE